MSLLDEIIDVVMEMFDDIEDATKERIKYPMIRKIGATTQRNIHNYNIDTIIRTNNNRG